MGGGLKNKIFFGIKVTFFALGVEGVQTCEEKNITASPAQWLPTPLE